MKTIEISEQQHIGYATDGPSRPIPLVLVHGFPSDSSVWEAMLPHLSDLPVIRIDMPGFGASSMPASVQLADYAHAIHEALQKLNVQVCVLAGHSMGGYVALEYLKHHGTHLAGLTLLHSHPYPDDEPRIQNRRRGIETLQQGKRDLYVTQLFPSQFAPAFVKEHPATIQKLTDSGKRQEAAGIIAALEAMINRRSYEDALKHAACPVQFILGAEDGLVPLEMGLKAATLPAKAEVHVLPGVGHMSMWEAPEECARFLREFYEGI
jgi:3-oxoadipate enol-lactonase